MSVNLRGRNFLTLKDFTPGEIGYMLNLSLDLKRKKRAGIRGDLLDRKSIVLIFEKASTRTRCAFETAAFDEGGSVTFLTNSQMGKKESIEDTAKVLGRFYDGIEFRGFKQETVKTLAEYAGVPVWNGLTDQYHPTQILADFLTVMEHCDKPLNRVKFVYAGDARNNMGNSLMIGAVKMGMHFVALAPKELFPSKELVAEMKEIAKETGAVIELSESLDAVKGADVIYTDVWVSMGEEAMFEQRIKQLKPYQVNM
ncbi:MAG: ornithine carbamoyltransferase, partial [Spirochaetes bacterium]